MRRVASWTLFVLAAVRISAQIPAPDSTGVDVGFVSIKEGGVPLAYSVVSAPALSRERFSDERGGFGFGDVPVGALRLRIRHVGYSPVELTVNVRAGMVDTVR